MSTREVPGEDVTRAPYSSSLVPCMGACGRGVPMGQRFCWTCDARREPRRPQGRWYVIWSYTDFDPMFWVAMVAFLIFTVACVIDGWAIGAAMGAWAAGSMSVLWLFLRNRFRMTTKRDGVGPRREQFGSGRQST